MRANHDTDGRRGINECYRVGWNTPSHTQREFINAPCLNRCLPDKSMSGRVHTVIKIILHLQMKPVAKPPRVCILCTILFPVVPNVLIDSKVARSVKSCIALKTIQIISKSKWLNVLQCVFFLANRIIDSQLKDMNPWGIGLMLDLCIHWAI